MNRTGDHSESLLLARNVHKSYGRKRVLNSVSIDIRPSEIVGIVGENGSGKSTLLRILLGLTRPDLGELVVRSTVGYCPQEMTVFENLTVDENIDYFGAAYGLSRNKSGDLAGRREMLLEQFRFGQFRSSIVSNLSGGTKQKLNLSLALLHDPGVLVLDEPYSGFDWETYLHFWELASSLRKSGTSCLVVSHLVYDHTKFDRIFELKDGRLH